MALTQGLQLPYGVQPVNPVPVDAWSGPYVAATAQDAIDAANAAITPAIRFQSMEVRLIIGGVSHKYWYRDGVADADLVEFSSGAGGGGGGGSGTGGLLTELVLNETPTGAIDGSNTAFTVANTPADPNSVMLWLNGQLMTRGSDYSVTGKNITFLIMPPQTGDVILSMYTKVVTVKQFAMNEVASQAVVGGTPGLKIQRAPDPVQSLMLFRNGQLLTLNSDYTISSTDISFSAGAIEPDDIFLATYSYLG